MNKDTRNDARGNARNITFRSGKFSNRPFMMALTQGNAPVRESQLQQTHRVYLPRLSQTVVDGVDVINISRMAETNIGHALSFEADCPFTHPDFGNFVSVRGFGNWIKSRDFDDNYRNLQERPLTAYFQANQDDQYDRVENYQYLMVTATWAKVKAFSEAAREEIAASTLPFEMYYSKLIDKTNRELGSVRNRQWPAAWFIPAAEKIRTALREKTEPDFSYLIADQNALTEIKAQWDAAKLTRVKPAKRKQENRTAPSKRQHADNEVSSFGVASTSEQKPEEITAEVKAEVSEQITTTTPEAESYALTCEKVDDTPAVV